jgi:hypothetical protein
MDNLFFKKVLETLNLNKEFPKYQLERRIDIYFNIFLPDIIKAVYGLQYEVNLIIPELPIKKENSNQSINIDYFCFCENTRTAFLIELKTDSGSCRVDQVSEYIRFRRDRFPDLLDSIMEIRTASKHKNKYDKLLVMLKGKIGSQTPVEILYLAPRAGINKLLACGLYRDIRFKPLDELKYMQAPTLLAHEWDQFINSGLF